MKPDRDLSFPKFKENVSNFCRHKLQHEFDKLNKCTWFAKCTGLNCRSKDLLFQVYFCIFHKWVKLNIFLTVPFALSLSFSRRVRVAFVAEWHNLNSIPKNADAIRSLKTGC